MCTKHRIKFADLRLSAGLVGYVHVLLYYEYILVLLTWCKEYLRVQNGSVTALHQKPADLLSRLWHPGSMNSMTLPTP